MKQKLIALQNNLNQHVIGREPVIKSALLSLVAGENILLIGPPGTAKSMIARSIAQVVQTEQKNNYFEYLLTKFSTPEEIFGPLSIIELKQDRFKRNTDGYLPTVQVAFLDEIFKASSSILNALLTILNERKYHNGTHTIDTPLISIISASNELPTGQAELSALYDRFLIRSYVDYLPNEGLSELFNFKNSVKSIEKLTHIDLQQIRSKAELVIFPQDIQQAILKIWQAVKDEFKDNTDESLSDRRFVKCLHLMRISAATNDRTEVDFSDVFLLKDCLWDVPENAEKVMAIIQDVLQKYDVLIDSSDQVELTSKEEKQGFIGLDNDPNTINLLNLTLKDFKGSGIQTDPYLIENIGHLQALVRPEVGRKGYYFKQVNNLHLGNIMSSSWIDINNFKGYYDGNNKTIACNNSDYFLFQNIHDSIIKNLTLQSISLSNTIIDSGVEHLKIDGILSNSIENSEINYCKASQYLVKDIERSSLQYCYAQQSLIDNNAKDCKILSCTTQQHLATNIFNSEVKYCLSYSTLINQAVVNSHIMDCKVKLTNRMKQEFTNVGGICARLSAKSKIERCFVSGQIITDHTVNFSSISYYIQSSTILKCAVGKININPLSKPIVFYDKIINQSDESCYFQNNIYMNNGTQLGNSRTTHQGRPVSTIDQELVKDHLNWDFKNIWIWNNSKNEPELRQNYTAFSEDTNTRKVQISLLKKQLEANIWL